MKLTIRTVAIVLIALQMSACTVTGVNRMLGFDGEKIAFTSVILSASGNANNNSATAVDLVLAMDEDIAQRLQEMSSERWFDDRVDLKNTFPKSIKYFSWELVPGQLLRVPGDSLERPRVVTAYVFSNYDNSGINRQRIEKFKGQLLIRLNDKNFEVINSQ